MQKKANSCKLIGKMHYEVTCQEFTAEVHHYSFEALYLYLSILMLI